MNIVSMSFELENCMVSSGRNYPLLFMYPTGEAKSTYWYIGHKHVQTQNKTTTLSKGLRLHFRRRVWSVQELAWEDRADKHLRL